MSSLVIMVPIAAGLILWDKLPEELPTHWGMSGQVNGWMGKGLTVFAIPVVMLLLHLLCVFVTAHDPKSDGHPERVIDVLLCICPMVSVLTGSMIYATAMGAKIGVPSWTMAGASVLFIILGNYLPKCKRNYTLGIKLPWTLNSDENWNATHRLAGKVWVIGGFLMLAACLLPEEAMFWAVLTAVVIMAAIPTVYSYWLYKKRGL